MPKGPQGQKRPGDVIGAAIMVAKIATGDVEDNATAPSEGRKAAARKGGIGRAASLTKTQKTEIARKAARSRWSANAAATGKKEHQEH
jgi:hypothetical protein